MPIEWTDRTWNPVRGCSRLSPGCDHWYAIPQANRSANVVGGAYEGLVAIRPQLARRGLPVVDWAGHARLVPKVLEVPLRRRKPTTYFVNSMSDLFHESLSDDEIAAVFGVMAATPRHTYIVLTKRSFRMRAEWFERQTVRGSLAAALDVVPCMAGWGLGEPALKTAWDQPHWPLPNVVLGVSVEDQQRADERIDDLLLTRAAVRLVSAEPLLGPIRLPDRLGLAETYGNPLVHVVIVGGESGPGARPFDVAWARSIRDQCREAGAAFFLKQLGANVRDGDVRIRLRDKKGGDMAEWPEDLRVRELPWRVG